MPKEKKKTVGYVVKENGEITTKFMSSLKEAKQFIREVQFPEETKVVEIVKVVTIETIMNTFVPQVVTKFVAVNQNKDEFDTGINEG